MTACAATVSIVGAVEQYHKDLLSDLFALSDSEGSAATHSAAYNPLLKIPSLHVEFRT